MSVMESFPNITVKVCSPSFVSPLTAMSSLLCKKEEEGGKKKKASISSPSVSCFCTNTKRLPGHTVKTQCQLKLVLKCAKSHGCSGAQRENSCWLNSSLSRACEEATHVGPCTVVVCSYLWLQLLTPRSSVSRLHQTH